VRKWKHVRSDWSSLLDKELSVPCQHCRYVSEGITLYLIHRHLLPTVRYRPRLHDKDSSETHLSWCREHFYITFDAWIHCNVHILLLVFQYAHFWHVYRTQVEKPIDVKGSHFISCHNSSQHFYFTANGYTSGREGNSRTPPSPLPTFIRSLWLLFVLWSRKWLAS